MRFKPCQVSVQSLLPVSISMNRLKQIKIIFLITAVLVLLFHFMFGLFMYPQQSFLITFQMIHVLGIQKKTLYLETFCYYNYYNYNYQNFIKLPYVMLKLLIYTFVLSKSYIVMKYSIRLVSHGAIEIKSIATIICKRY